MTDAPLRLTAAKNVDTDAECLYHIARYTKSSNDSGVHQHEFYEIFLTVEGTTTHYINGKIQVLPSGSLVFIRPDDTHGFRYGSKGDENCSHINLTFTVNTAELLFGYLSDSFPSKRLLEEKMPPTVYLTEQERDRLVKQIEELNLAHWSDKNALKIRMRAILADIFTRYFSQIPQKEEERSPLWLERLMNEMELPENFKQGLERMTELSGKTREHLSRSLKKYKGVSISEYINSLRINYSSNLLINTNIPIINICYDAGFGSLSYFYRVFNDHHGVSPKDFRERNRRIRYENV